jgi:hypothetical protein
MYDAAGFHGPLQKPYSTWTIVVPLPGAWMYLASPRASPSWTSSTGKKYTQAARQRSVMHEQDEGIGFTDLLRMIRKVYEYRMHSFFSFRVLCLVPSAELLRGTY